MKRTPKGKPNRLADDKTRAQWNRAIAIGQIAECDLYCVGCRIEDAFTTEVTDVLSLHEAESHEWDTPKETFHPRRSVVSKLVINRTLPVNLSKPLGHQVAVQLRTIATELEAAAKEMDNYEDCRDMGLIKKLAAGKFVVRQVPNAGLNTVEVIDRKGKVVPIVEREI